MGRGNQFLWLIKWPDLLSLIANRLATALRK